jgi:FlaG/FlaF family flagellin (archaellin)
MAGGVVFVVAMVVAVPVGVMLAGALWSAVFGEVASADREPGTADPAAGD